MTRFDRTVLGLMLNRDEGVDVYAQLAMYMFQLDGERDVTKELRRAAKTFWWTRYRVDALGLTEDGFVLEAPQ